MKTAASKLELRSTVRDAGALRREFAQRYLLTAFLILIAIVWLSPAFWALTTSLKTADDVIKAVPYWIPNPLSLESYASVFATDRTGGIARPVLNSAIYAVATTVLTLVICVITAFPLARMRFPGRDVVFAIVVGSIMVPDIVTLVPMFLLMAQLGWLNSYQALIVPNLASAFGVFLLRQFFLSLPSEMEDAARIDGANSLQILTRVLLPLSQPALMALTIFTVRGSWNDFTWPLIVMTSEQMYTLPVALALLHTDYSAEAFGPIMAGAVISALPILAVFLVANRYIVEGVQLSGLKG
jgi:multiple sugar transport system permease protein